MTDSSDKDSDLNTESKEITESVKAEHSTRRRFTRNATVGAAVMLTLGNRAAWGDSNITVGCLSGPAFASMDAGAAAGMFPSAANVEKIDLYNDIVKLNADTTGAMRPFYSKRTADGGYCVQHDGSEGRRSFESNVFDPAGGIGTGSKHSKGGIGTGGKHSKDADLFEPM